MPGADVRVEPGEDLVEVGVDPGDRRPGQRAGEVAVLAVRRAALGEVDAPVGARRDRLQLALRRRADDDGQRRLGPRVGRALVGAPQARDPVAAEELDVVDPGGLDPPQDLGRVRALGGRPGDDDVAGRPEPGAGRGERMRSQVVQQRECRRPFPPRGLRRSRCGEYVDRSPVECSSRGTHVSLQAAPRTAAVTTGAFILSSGLDKWKGDEQTAGRRARLRHRHLPVPQADRAAEVPQAARRGRDRRRVGAAAPGRARRGRRRGARRVLRRVARASTSGRRECAAAASTRARPRRACRSPRTSGCSATGLGLLIDGLTAKD